MPEVQDLTIRRYQHGDEMNMETIFRETAHQGLHDAGDAALHIGFHIWCKPYFVLHPDDCFILDDQGQAVGYVLGTPDTRRFVEAWKKDYLALLEAEGITKPAPHEDASQQDSVNALRMIAHTPEEQLLNDDELVDRFPGHLHIDIRRDWQALGMGSKMIETLLTHLKSMGCRGIHLGMAASNLGVAKFYERVGFSKYTKVDDGTVMVKTL